MYKRLVEGRRKAVSASSCRAWRDISWVGVWGEKTLAESDLEPANVESGNWKEGSQFGNAGFYNSK